MKSFPYVAVATRDGSRIFVTNQHDDSISVFDGKSYQPLGLVSGCGYPEGLAVAPDQGAVLAACWMDDALVVIDVKSLTVTKKIPVGASPRAFGQFIAPDTQ